MSIHSLVVALLFSAPLLCTSTSAGPTNDPRIAINAVNTPGDSDSLYRITASGSYYLEEPLLGLVGKIGIEIAASDVHVDLMGFSMQGVSNTRSAIDVPVSKRSITVRNGSISTWGGSGVNLAFVEGARVEDITVAQGGGAGILTGDGAVIKSCIVREAGGFGILAGGGSLVAGCVVSDSSNGIGVGDSSTVRDCSVRMCTGFGITCGTQSSVFASTVSHTSILIHSPGRLLVVDCILGNGALGVQLQTGAVRGCTITGNSGHGVEASGGAHISGNHIAENSSDGIRMQGNGRVENNDCRGNGGAGVRVLGTGAVVVKNTLMANGFNLLVPNSGNFVGPLLHVNGLNGRDNPWANIYAP